MSAKKRRVAIEVLGAAVLLCWTRVACAQATTMYTFRGGQPGYTGLCKGVVRQRLGWLDANGRPIRVPFADRINVIERIQGAGLRVVAVGFISNPAGAPVANARAYDLNRTGLIEAYTDAFAAPGGAWFNCTEGGFRVDDTGAMIKGGLIELDNGTPFSGFRPPGTGVAGSNP